MRTLPAGSGAAELKTGSRPKLEAAKVDAGAAPPEGPPREGSQRVHSLPPFDPTVARPSRKPLPRATHPTPKPILASECLRDDDAPIEPRPRATRFWSLGLGLAITVVSIVMAARAWPLADAVALRTVGAAAGIGVVVAVVALALSRYTLRGGLTLGAVGIGVAALVLFRHEGPLLYARWLAPAPLAAALFLRVSYRSDATVRAILAISIALFAAAAFFVGGSLVMSAGVSLVARLFAAAMGLVAGLSLLGFMGEETTAGCTLWGTLAAVLGGGSLVVDAFVRTDSPGTLPLVVAALAVPIAAIAIFQIVATVVGPRLRLKTTSRTSIPAPPSEEHDSDEPMLHGDD